jgi:hypothetical protein
MLKITKDTHFIYYNYIKYDENDKRLANYILHIVSCDGEDEIYCGRLFISNMIIVILEMEKMIHNAYGDFHKEYVSNEDKFINHFISKITNIYTIIFNNNASDIVKNKLKLYSEKELLLNNELKNIMNLNDPYIIVENISKYINI